LAVRSFENKSTRAIMALPGSISSTMHILHMNPFFPPRFRCFFARIGWICAALLKTRTCAAYTFKFGKSKKASLYDVSHHKLLRIHGLSLVKSLHEVPGMYQDIILESKKSPVIWLTVKPIFDNRLLCNIRLCGFST
jgi:hypothetical protein